MGNVMKIVTGISTIAAILGIATYFGIQPEVNAEQPTFNTGSGSGNVQINNSSNFSVGGQSNTWQPEKLDCQDKQIVVTKAGFYGAINADAYQTMHVAIHNKDENAISSLIKNGVVVEIPKAVPACVEANAFHTYKKQIRLPGSQVAYWVSDDAVTNAD